VPEGYFLGDKTLCDATDFFGADRNDEECVEGQATPPEGEDDEEYEKGKGLHGRKGERYGARGSRERSYFDVAYRCSIRRIEY
jgi:hypothetical protein